MKTVFLTGGTGFIGRRLIKQLLEKKYTVRALARSQSSAHTLEQMGAQPVQGDILDPASLTAGLDGVDVVFHLAGRYRIGDTDWRTTELINVSGTRNVLTQAHRAGVPKIIYTSSVAVFGDTADQLVDETYDPPQPTAGHYARTKWLAHYDVGQRLIDQGAPITIVMPGGVYGPHDTSFIGELMRRFYLRQPPFPFLLGPKTKFTFAHVDDVAAGHIAAAEKGTAGESYILAGPAVSLAEIVDFWARLTGKRPPTFHLPARLVRPLAPFSGRLHRRLGLSQLFSEEAVSVLGRTYIASSAKAEAQLGWRARPLQAGMLDTFGHIAADVAANPQPVSRSREYGTVGLGVGLTAMVIWLFYRWRRSNNNSG